MSPEPCVTATPDTAPGPPPAPRYYLPAFDGLRALAVVAVIAYHLNPAWLPGGMLGVGVFFVLSGYLITDLLADDYLRNGRIDLRGFWWRRARRLLPALAVLLAAVVAWMTLTRPTELPALRADVVAAAFYVSNWWFIFHHVSYFARFGPVSPLGNLWSLAVEEQFYLVWPLLLYAGLRWLPSRGSQVVGTLTAAAASALTMALLYHPGTNPTRIYDGTDTRAFSLLIGAAAALLWPSRTLVRQALRWTLKVAGGLGLLVVLLMFFGTNPYESLLYRGGMVVLSLAVAALVLVAAHPDSRIGKALAWRPLRWLGERSYGIYLWHYPVIVLTTPIVPSGGVDAPRVLAQVGTSVGLAALSYRYVEQPVRRGDLGRFLQGLRRKTLPRLRPATAVAGIASLGVLTIASLGLAGLVPTTAHAATRPRSSGHATSPKRRHHLTSGVSTPTPSGPGPQSHPTARLIAARSQAATAVPACRSVTAIGDSVLLDTVPYLKRAIPDIVVDGRVGRQLFQAGPVVTRLRAREALGTCVVLELGTNGPFTSSTLDGLLHSLRDERRIVLVNTRVPRPWETYVNALLAHAAATFPHTVLVHWHAASAHHPTYFQPDGVHLHPAGARRLVALIRQALGFRTATGSDTHSHLVAVAAHAEA